MILTLRPERKGQRGCDAVLRVSEHQVLRVEKAAVVVLVLDTGGHIELAKALGWERCRELTETLKIPWYVLTYVERYADNIFNSSKTKVMAWVAVHRTDVSASAAQRYPGREERRLEALAT